MYLLYSILPKDTSRQIISSQLPPSSGNAEVVGLTVGLSLGVLLVILIFSLLLIVIIAIKKSGSLFIVQYSQVESCVEA